jgi:hypothetical protein
MKKFIFALKFVVAFVSGLLAFVLAGLVVSMLRSDSVDVPDGVDRLGFPFVFKEQSGPVAMDYFSWTWLICDLVIALAVSAGIAFYFARTDAAR